MTPLILLPGILMPAAPRYEALLAALGNAAATVLKDLEVYRSTSGASGNYSLEHELGGLARAADAAGFERFHLYGHSAGGAVALAFAARNPERVLSLALDEPASDFSVESQTEIRSQFLPLLDLPNEQMMSAFVRSQVGSGVTVPSAREPPPPWMASRPTGIRAFLTALAAVSVSSDFLAPFAGPTYYSYGSLTHERWHTMAERLSARLPNFSSERYLGAHHLRTSHVTEPARVAAALTKLWASV
jgi:pimeloyl-ACP methyl ester carboxylesterase